MTPEPTASTKKATEAANRGRSATTIAVNSELLCRRVCSPAAISAAARNEPRLFP